jgi:hypothetical protein
MITRPLTTNERAETPGYTHVTVLTTADIAAGIANNTAASWTVALSTYDIIGRVQDFVKTPFQNTADAAFNSTTRSLGDNSAVTTHTTAAEANANGTVVYTKFSNTAVGPYTAANTLKITLNAMSGKSLSNLNKGELHVFFQLIRIKPIVDAIVAS